LKTVNARVFVFSSQTFVARCLHTLSLFCGIQNQHI
jgi:hypothetical protein